MDIAVLFSGQGAQKVGMGSDLAALPQAQALFSQADAVLGESLSRIMFEGPMEELTRTSRCQPALYTHGLALLALLRHRLPALHLRAAAGLSLGEFTAHAAAGSFDFATGLRLVFERGRFMEDACLATKGGMLALLGGEVEAVQRLAAQCGVDVANYNAPGQIVLSGSLDGIEKAAAAAKDFGVKRAIPLQVAGAYHSRLMQAAQDRLKPVLQAAALQSPGCTVVSNVLGGAVNEPGAIREALAAQVTGSVRWVECMQHLIAAGHRRFVELGPDATLAGLMGKLDKSIEVISIRDLATLDEAVARLGA
jgi:[acyl-carrier-protein] S-malonyltransferase